MDMMTPAAEPGARPAPAEEAEAAPGTVTIAKAADGFTVNGKPAKTIDEALNMAREILTGDDGGMSVEEAFRGGFRGSELPPGDPGY
jgi:hypothetical protein